jgi:hypothetical protein
MDAVYDDTVPTRLIVRESTGARPATSA